MFDKYLYALGRGVRGAKKAYEKASRPPDPAEAARDITPPPEPAATPKPPRTLIRGPHPHIMGIVNVTPDSFSDGGAFSNAEEAIAHGLRLVAEGAAILDVGGESTRPGHTEVSPEEEIARVIPVVRGLAAATDTPISIDTMKASVARAALDAGASIVNDVWGFQRDPDMAPLVAERKVLGIVMHNRDSDDPTIDVMEEVMTFLRRSIEIGRDAGVERELMIVDPGFGFGKTHAQSLTLVRDLARLKQLGCPILLGASRKRAIGKVTGRDVARERVIGSVAAAVIGAAAGAAFIRVHDVAAHLEAMKIFAAINNPALGDV